MWTEFLSKGIVLLVQKKKRYYVVEALREPVDTRRKMRGSDLLKGTVTLSS